MAIQAAFPNTTTAWVSDFDTGPNKILAHRYPDVPNLGDLTQIDWSTVEPVDIIAGGFPCQDVSQAGRRAGMTEGTRSNLWGAMRTAIETIRPRYVVAENVRGLLSATAQSDSDLEPGGGPLGNPGTGHLRALGRVLGDLADLGYDASWCGLRAADVGAPHGRFRVFIVAEDSLRGGGGGRAGVTSDSASERSDAPAHRPDSRPDPSGNPRLALLPTPRATDGPHGGPNQRGSKGDLMLSSAVHQLLPTPVAQPSRNTPEDHLRQKPGRTRVTDLSIMVENGLLATGGQLLPTPRATRGGSHTETAQLLPTPDAYAGNRGGSQHPDKKRAGGHMVTLQDVTEHALLPTPTASEANGIGAHGTGALDLRTTIALLPTPKAGDADMGFPRTSGRPPEMSTHLATRLHYTDFGTYAPAVTRWERVIGRPAPAPTEPNGKNRPRLSARFVEWMMGLPEGWVTDTPGISRNEALKALGNGVVPQQGAVAIRHLLDLMEGQDQ